MKSNFLADVTTDNGNRLADPKTPSEPKAHLIIIITFVFVYGLIYKNGQKDTKNLYTKGFRAFSWAKARFNKINKLKKPRFASHIKK